MNALFNCRDFFLGIVSFFEQSENAVNLGLSEVVLISYFRFLMFLNSKVLICEVEVNSIAPSSAYLQRQK